MDKEYALNSKMILRREKFGALLIKRGTIEIYIFNNFGYDILKMFYDGKCSGKKIVDAYKNIFALENSVLEKDVDTFIKLLIKSDLLDECI